MISSRYNVYFDNHVYNARQRSHIVLPENLINAIKISDFSLIDPAVITLLRQMGMVFENSFSEDNLFEFWYYQKIQNPELGISLLPTYSCNCKCIYCFEDGIQIDPAPITKPGYIFGDVFLPWVENLILALEPKELDFSFHGGEPLLRTELVFQIGKGINHLADRNNLKKQFSIVTNGILLTKDVITQLLDLQIDKALLTIDGPENIHNKRRVCKDLNNPFRVIFNNMQLALDSGMQINLGINFDRMNIDGIFEFLNDMKQLGLNSYNNLSLIFGAVKQGVTQTNISYFKDYEMENSEIARAMANLYNAALGDGFNIVDPLTTGFCTMNKSWVFMVDILGRIYKCITLVGRNESFIGNITDPVEILFQNLTQIRTDKLWRDRESCTHCTYLPLCFGGCYEQTILHRKEGLEVDCQKSFYDVFLPEALKIRTLRKIHDNHLQLPE